MTSLRLVLWTHRPTGGKGCTKRSGRSRGRSPRYVGAERLPGRQYLALSEDTARRCHYSHIAYYLRCSSIS